MNDRPFPWLEILSDKLILNFDLKSHIYSENMSGYKVCTELNQKEIAEIKILSY